MSTASLEASGRGAGGASSERRRLVLLAAAVALLHVAGWGLIAIYAPSHPVFGGLGVLAYTFGLRHAFDVDHIAAIDNMTRKLLHDGERPLGVGFFFSLGHSTIVFGLAVGLALGAWVVGSAIPGLQSTGGLIGTTVSGTFLCLIGILNLFVLIDILKLRRGLRHGRLDEDALERRLAERGFMSRLFLGRLGRLVGKSWHMYPLGLLFGLGFDTASEIGLLALTASAASGHVPILAALSLPLLFAAGMSLMDTIDGIFMSKAYGWASTSPRRKLSYNVTVTSFSVVVAVAVGAVEVAHVIGRMRPGDPALTWLGGLDLAQLGYWMVAVFLLAWTASALVWKARRVEER